ncbi:hypothetical protein D3C76_604260 [compost metagenome]
MLVEHPEQQVGAGASLVGIELVTQQVMQTSRRRGAGDAVSERQPHIDLAQALRVASRIPLTTRVVACSQVAQNRLRVAQHKAVIIEHWQLAKRVEREEVIALMFLAREELDADFLVVKTEHVHEEAQLVAVARQFVVVQRDHFHTPLQVENQEFGTAARYTWHQAPATLFFIFIQVDVTVLRVTVDHCDTTGAAHALFA